MFKKTFLIALLFFSALICFLVATLPASVAWNYFIAPNTLVLSTGVKPRSFSGSLWEGKAHLSFRHLEGVVSWDLGVGSIFFGRLPLELDLVSSAGTLDAELSVGLSTQSLLISSLEVDLSKMSQFTRMHRIGLDGKVFAKDLSAVMDGGEVSTVTGRFSWTGGEVSYPAGREKHDRTLGPFAGRVITEQSGAITLGIRDADASFDVLRGSWGVDGVALWEVTRRMLDLADEPWAQNSQETDVIFKVKKTISRDLSKS